MDVHAKLVLEDGTTFIGRSFGFQKPVSGEVVFNTGMTGYPETLTDPSYRGQILVLTYPLIGNYGVPGKRLNQWGFEDNFESGSIHVTGLVVASYIDEYSHWDARQSLGEWLRHEKIPAITGIDTKALTKKLREKGVMLGRIIFDEDISIDDPNKRNLVAEVSCREPVTYGSGDTRIVLVDCGVKNSILKCLLETGATVIRVPWDHDFSGMEYDGLVISNGPGDPKMCRRTIEHVRKAIQAKPVFGVCLGNQIVGLASGADTYKLKYGHRGQNQPAVELLTGRSYLTSQNHGFAVDTATLPQGWKPWFSNANDGTNEGIIHESGMVRTVQFHPEAAPGPTDTAWLFSDFMKLVRQCMIISKSL